MSHYESFDPKPNAPAEVRGEFKPIGTPATGNLCHFFGNLSICCGDFRLSRSYILLSAE